MRQNKGLFLFGTTTTTKPPFFSPSTGLLHTDYKLIFSIFENDEMTQSSIDQ